MNRPLPEPTVRWALLSWRGRLGRQSYFWGAALLIMAQVYLFVSAVGLDRGNDTEMLSLGFGAILLWFMSAWAMLAMSVKRLHDIGLPAIFALCLVVPFFSLLFLIAMMIIPGSQETNEHGPPPFPENKN